MADMDIDRHLICVGIVTVHKGNDKMEYYY